MKVGKKFGRAGGKPSGFLAVGQNGTVGQTTRNLLALAQDFASPLCQKRLPKLLPHIFH